MNANAIILECRPSAAIARRIALHQQRARKHNRTAGFFCPSDWRRCCAWFDYRCCYCGSDDPLTMEHFIPLTMKHCPGTTVWNIVPACQTCNKHKRSRNPYTWLKMRFGEARADEIAQRIECYFEQAETRSGQSH